MGAEGGCGEWVRRVGAEGAENTARAVATEAATTEVVTAAARLNLLTTELTHLLLRLQIHHCKSSETAAVDLVSRECGTVVREVRLTRGTPGKQ